MMLYKKIFHSCLGKILLFNLSLITLSACVSDPISPETGEEGEEIIFSALAEINETVATRAITTIQIPGDRYTGKFHIYMEGWNRQDVFKSEASSYIIPSPYSGILQADALSKPLNWFSRKSLHFFWSWTTPWNDEVKTADEENPDYEPEEVYTPTNEPFDILFPGSSITETTSSGAGVWQSNSWKNGEILEKFIGAGYEPSRYEANGKFLSFQYRHLVSKILVGSFVIIDNSTANPISTLKGNITLYGLPKKAKFYPAPKKITDQGDTLTFRPYVEMDPNHNYPQDEGVTFAITNFQRYHYNDAGNAISNTTTGSSTYYWRDIWYICPEVDFSRLSFKIEIYEWDSSLSCWKLSSSHGHNGAFYGDFKNVTFTRNKDNYDNPNGGDETILHAGEYLAIAFNLSTKGNPSIRAEIFDWSQRNQNRDAKQHERNGVYTLGEATDLSDVMKSKDVDQMKDYYDIYGSGENTDDDPSDPNYGDNLDIFKLYEDVGSTGSSQNEYTGPSGKMKEFYVGDGYILDGQGHTVNVATTSLTIGHVRNIFFRYHIAGTNTSTGITTHTINIVYVDSEGKVWLVDPNTFKMTDTGNNVNDMTKNPFTINLKTGALS